MSERKSHSAKVEMNLVIEGSIYGVHSCGPGEFTLRKGQTAFLVTGYRGVLAISIDGSPSATVVRLTEELDDGRWKCETVKEERKYIDWPTHTGPWWCMNVRRPIEVIEIEDSHLLYYEFGTGTVGQIKKSYGRRFAPVEQKPEVGDGE